MRAHVHFTIAPSQICIAVESLVAAFILHSTQVSHSLSSARVKLIGKSLHGPTGIILHRLICYFQTVISGLAGESSMHFHFLFVCDVSMEYEIVPVWAPLSQKGRNVSVGV